MAAMKGTSRCASQEISPATALGRIEAAQILLDVAESSERVREHPLFDGAHRVFQLLSFEPRIGQPSGTDWEEVRDQLETLGRRLDTYLPK